MGYPERDGEEGAEEEGEGLGWGNSMRFDSVCCDQNIICVHISAGWQRIKFCLFERLVYDNIIP